MALELSLAHGGGDLHWFEQLPHEDQVRMLAYHRVLARRRKPERGDDRRWHGTAPPPRELTRGARGGR